MPINFQKFPLREFKKSRELAWDPAEIDFSKDAKDWLELKPPEQDLLLRQIVGFLIGERAVTHDLAPLQQALRRERGRMEEEMYLTVQIYEEAIHVEFFQRWINASLPGVLGKDIPYPPLEGDLFSEALPQTMQALNTDSSPEAQLRAAVIYHMIIEGVLAESGYQIFYNALDRDGILPALRFGVQKIQRDESRHIAFGIYFIQRLISEHPHLEELFESEMEKYHPMVQTANDRFFGAFDGDIPFGLEPERFSKLREQLFETRMRTVKSGDLVAADAAALSQSA